MSILVTRHLKSLRSALHIPMRSLNIRNCATNSMVDARDRVVVVGGGIAGLSASLALSKVKIPVLTLERSPELRMEGSAIGILANGWKALEALDVAEELRKENVLCTNAEWWSSSGERLKTFSLANAKGENEMRGVMRKELVTSLADALPSDSLLFDHELVSIDFSTPNQPLLKFKNGTTIKCRVVIGAEGGRSRIATALGLSFPQYSGYCAIRGISHFGDYGLSRQTISYHLGPEVRFGMYQVESDKVYWFVAFNENEGANIPDEDTIAQKAKQLSMQFNRIVQECVNQTIPGCLSFAKIGDRIATPSNTPEGSMVSLCGDAFHPMTPNLGQGGALALEDSVVLAQCLSSAGGLSSDDQSIISALKQYEETRLKRVVPLTVRSRFVGAALQISFPPVSAAAQFMIANVLNPGNVYLSSAQYNCGTLATA